MFGVGSFGHDTFAQGIGRNSNSQTVSSIQTPAPALTAIKVFPRTITATVTPAASVLWRWASWLLSVDVSVVPSLSRTVGKPILAGVGPFSLDAIGLYSHYDASLLSGADGDPVSTFPDGKGGFDATGGNGTNPQLHVGGLNGLNTLNQAGSANTAAMTLNSTEVLVGETEASWFVVCKHTTDPPANGVDGAILDGFTSDTGTNRNSHHPYTDGVIYEHFGMVSRETTVNPTPSLASWRIYCVQVGPSGFKNFLDGTQLFSDPSITVNFGTGKTKYFLRNFVGDVWQGEIAEMLLFNSELTADQRQGVEGYLAKKWGLINNLPLGHPYASNYPVGPLSVSMSKTINKFITAVQLVNYPYQLSLINPGFETGDTTGWSAILGTGLPGISSGGHSGSFHVSGSATLGNAWWGQTVDLPSTVLSAVDAGYLKAIGYSYHAGFSGDSDDGALMIEFYDGAGGTGNLLAANRNNYTDPTAYVLDSIEYPVPIGTRSIRLSTQNRRNSGTELSTYWDDFDLWLDVNNFARQHDLLISIDGSSASASGWTLVSGSPLAAETGGGTWNFTGLVAQGASFTGYKEASIDSKHHSAIDAGLGTIYAFYLLGRQTTSDNDQGRVWIEARDGSGTILQTWQSSAGLVAYGVDFSSFLVEDILPSGTRTIRFNYQTNDPNAGGQWAESVLNRASVLVSAAQGSLPSTVITVAGLNVTQFKTVSIAVDVAVSLIRAIGKLLDIGTTPSPSLDATPESPNIPVTINASSTPSAGIVRSIGKLINGESDSTASIVRDIAISILGTTQPVPAIVNVINKTLSIPADTSATINLAIYKVLSVACDTASTMFRQTGKVLAASADTAPDLTASRAFLKTITASADTAASLVRSITKGVSTTADTAASMSRTLAKNLRASATTSAKIFKTTSKNLSATGNVVATLQKAHPKTFNVSTQPEVTFSAYRRSFISLSISADTSASIFKTIAKKIAVLVQGQARVTKSMSVVLSADADTSAKLNRAIGVTLNVSADVETSLFKRIGKILTIDVTVDPDPDVATYVPFFNFPPPFMTGIWIA